MVLGAWGIPGAQWAPAKTELTPETLKARLDQATAQSEAHAARARELEHKLRAAEAANLRVQECVDGLPADAVLSVWSIRRALEGQL
jgi:hypothetical protein